MLSLYNVEFIKLVCYEQLKIMIIYKDVTTVKNNK